MAGKMLNLYAPGRATLAPLASLIGGESQAIATILRRYAELVREARPEFTLDEWEAIIDANNGEWTAWMVGDSPRLELIDDDLAAKHEIDAGAVNATLAGLEYAGRLAVFDLIERAWASPLGASRAAVEEAMK